MAVVRRHYIQTPVIFVVDKRVLLSHRGRDVQQDHPYTAEAYPPSLRYKFILPRITGGENLPSIGTIFLPPSTVYLSLGP